MRITVQWTGERTCMVGRIRKIFIGNMSKFRCSFIYVQVATRMNEVDGIIHSCRCCTACCRMLLLKRCTRDNAFKIGNREYLITRHIGRMRGDCLKTYIIQGKIITSVLRTLIKID